VSFPNKITGSAVRAVKQAEAGHASFDVTMENFDQALGRFRFA
jgi:hypothetical protein